MGKPAGAVKFAGLYWIGSGLCGAVFARALRPAGRYLVSPSADLNTFDWLGMPTRLPALAARGLILVYRVSLSAVAGRWCRHAPSCSAYADEALSRHGLWAGGWMSLARVCRCRPGGTSGFDPPPLTPPSGADALHPWRYGQWRGPLRCDAVEDQDRAICSSSRL